jgi:hypothetical protein
MSRLMRVLHLVSTGADFQTRRTQELLCREAGDEFHSQRKTIGRGGDFRSTAIAAVRLRGGDAQIVHAWGQSALTAAAFAGCRSILFSPDSSMDNRAIGWARAIMDYRDVQMVCASAVQQRRAVRSGVPASRCHLICPAVEFARLGGRRNDEFRKSLGLARDDFVLLAPGESVRAARHELAIWTGGILNVLDSRFKVLLWGPGESAAAALRLGRALKQELMARSAQATLGAAVEFEKLLTAADACLVTADGAAPTLPIAICMAAAVPIVSVTNYTTAELLEDRHTALMTAKPSARLLAQRVQDLQADSTLAWSIADMARTEAYEYFSASRLLDQYRTVYRQMAEEQPVTVPQMAARAGLRFHGRG